MLPSTLTPGSRLGPYEIVAPLGAGGMGEVYRARDTRLDRTVAIKVLPADFTGDPQSRARFDREARALSQLTHPHICTLHDVGVEGDTPYLVMELLQGQTLAERLTKGALPLDEALTIAIQIADALSAAHKHGIAHRDLKPLNIMLTRSGAKLLDFGLAKAAAPAVAVSARSTHDPASTQLTGQGTILGTLHYMAPEQVEGREADTRSDLWALGAVIYEMVTGQLAFAGESSAAVVGAILKDRPLPLAERRPEVPPALDHLVARCLEKDPDERWQSARDLRQHLAWVATGPGRLSAAVGATAHLPRTPRHTGTRLAWAVAAGAVVLAGLLAFPTARHLRETPPPALPVQFSLQAPSDTLWTPGRLSSNAQFAVSADGQRLAFVAGRRGGVPQIWVRSLDRLQAEAVAGTDGASFPFWAPDGRAIGFFSERKLKTVGIAGGAPLILADAPIDQGGAWGPDGTILFAARIGGMWRIPSTGGTVAAATTLNSSSGAIGHSWPQFLPDGRHFLFYQRGATPEAQGVYVGSLDSPATTPVLRTVSMGIYSLGHLLFARDSMLFAQAFDLQALTTSGAPVRVADHVGYFTAALGAMAASASATGTLVIGPGVAPTTELRWFDRAGASLGVAGTPAVHTSPRLSPEQQSVAVSIHDTTTAQRDVWVMDLIRGAASRATFDRGNDWFPAWAPDGNRLFFSSARNDAGMTIYQRAGAAPDRTVAGYFRPGGVTVYANDVSGDGRDLLYTEVGSNAYDLGVVTLADAHEPSLFLSTPFNEAQGRFSPDSRWVAYASDESGRFEVYVRRFPATNEQWRVSIAGGQQPEWRRDGKELFYVAPDHKLMAVPVASDGRTFTAGAPQALFDVAIPEVSAPYPTEYAVAGDGQRFLVNTVVEQKNQPTLTVVLNWLEELRARASSQ